MAHCGAGVPGVHRREIQAIFPDLDLQDMLIVPTCQHTDVDLVNFGDNVEKEKDMIHTHYHQPYSEIDGLIVLCRYQTQNAGCCKVVLHPKWGSSVYPASLFAKAPYPVLDQAIQETNALLRDGKLDYKSQ